MDGAGVTAAVIHPPGWDPTSTAYATEVVARWPHRFARYAAIDPTDPSVADELRRLQAAPGVLGVRFLCLSPQERCWPTDGTLEPVFETCEQLDFPVALCGPTLMPVVDRTARRHPDLMVVVDHFAMTGYADDGGLVQSPDVLSWAEHPRVVVKLTGAPDYATDDYPFPGMLRVVRDLHAAYGAERLFWGTDITRVDGHGGTRRKATMAQTVTMLTEHLGDLPAGDVELMMGAAYCRWHRWWPEPAGPAY